MPTVMLRSRLTRPPASAHKRIAHDEVVSGHGNHAQAHKRERPTDNGETRKYRDQGNVSYGSEADIQSIWANVRFALACQNHARSRRLKSRAGPSSSISFFGQPRSFASYPIFFEVSPAFATQGRGGSRGDRPGRRVRSR